MHRLSLTTSSSGLGIGRTIPMTEHQTMDLSAFFVYNCFV